MTWFSKGQWKSTVLLLVLVFVTVSAGITAGLYISQRLGLATWTRSATLRAADLPNSTRLKLGDQFPPCPVTDSNGNTVELRDLLAGHKTIIGVVSNGCEACTEFLGVVENGKLIPRDFNFVLISTEPEYFKQNYRYPVIGVPPEFMMRCGIHSSPTIIGVDASATLKVISSAYSVLLNPSFMERSI